MVKFSVFYPAGEGTHFDMGYYTATHMPMAGSLLGPMGVVKAELDRPLGGLPGQPAPFAAAVHIYFETVEQLTKALETHNAALAADVPNFTNIQPIFQVSDVG
ncbi:MAG: EthD family reductase [Vicinamibacterales bacterium]